MQDLHEDHCVDFLSMLKESVRAEKRLKTKISQNEELLIQRKREEKLNRKELDKMKLLHPNPVSHVAATQSAIQDQPQVMLMGGLFGQ